MGLLDDIGKYEADKEFFDKLEKLSAKVRVDSSIIPGPPPKADAFAPIIPPWEHDVERGMATMEEILGEEYGMMKVPEAPKVTITPRGERIIPVRAVRRMSAREIGALRRSMEVDQINERMVSELMHPLLKQLDEMGLIELQINQVDPEILEYSLTLNVVKDERG